MREGKEIPSLQMGIKNSFVKVVISKINIEKTKTTEDEDHFKGHKRTV